MGKYRRSASPRLAEGLGDIGVGAGRVQGCWSQPGQHVVSGWGPLAYGAETLAANRVLDTPAFIPFWG